MSVWHVQVNGTPACTSPLLREEERVEFPLCGTRNRAVAEGHARELRDRHPEAEVEVVQGGCHVRGE